jgi:phage terminase large subunit-like protein
MSYADSLVEKLKPETQKMVKEYCDLDIKSDAQDWRWFHKYPAHALMGKIPACKTIIQASFRHFKDTERDDIYVCETATKSIMAWFGFIPIPDGNDAGKPLTLNPPLIWMSVSLIAWRWSSDEYEEMEGERLKMRTAGTRRFKETFNLVARKFSKTTWAAAMGLYLLKKGPFKPRGYTFATTLTQAKEVWGAAVSMIDLSPHLQTDFTHNKITTNSPIISMPKKSGSLIAKAGNSDKQDGLNPIFAVLDECHAITDYNTYGVITSAFGAQEEYLFMIITTAGTVLDGLCTTLHKNALRALDPSDEFEMDTSFFAIFQIDEDDDWSDERAWLKANPSTLYGRPSMQYLRGEYNKALNSFEQKANFLTKHCNKFVNGADKWLDIEVVRNCKNENLKFDDFKHKKCYVGFDRSLGGDVTSLCVLFPDDDGGVTVFWFNLQTQAVVMDSTDYLMKIYQKAEAAGFIRLITESTHIRNEHVKRLIREVYSMLPLCESIGYDPYHMKEVAMDLEDEGLPMLSVSQGPGNMSEPAKKFESMIQDGLFRYNGDTMFEFACTCAVMDLTKFNNMAIYKEDYKNEKIDPLAAFIIALSSATLFTSNSSVYNHRGLTVI